MLGNRFWLAFVAVYVVSQLLNFLIHSVWLDPDYAGLVGVFRSEEEMIPLSWVFFVTGMVMVFFSVSSSRAATRTRASARACATASTWDFSS